MHRKPAPQRVDHLLELNFLMLVLGGSRIVGLEARIGILRIEASVCLAVGVADLGRPHAGKFPTRRRVRDLKLIPTTISELMANYRIRASVCRKAENLAPKSCRDFHHQLIYPFR